MRLVRLLDLFCGAGGVVMAYRGAGFTEIVGVEDRFMPRCPFRLIWRDALGYLREHGPAGWRGMR